MNNTLLLSLNINQFTYFIFLLFLFSDFMISCSISLQVEWSWINPDKKLYNSSQNWFMVIKRFNFSECATKMFMNWNLNSASATGNTPEALLSESFANKSQYKFNTFHELCYLLPIPKVAKNSSINYYQFDTI